MRVSADEVTVSHQIGASARTVWTSPTAFTRVSVEAPDAHEARVRLHLSARPLTIARALSPHERVRFAEALEAAIRKARAEAGIRGRRRPNPKGCSATGPRSATARRPGRAHRRRRWSMLSPERSAAVKLISSTTFSSTVCSRRAPMFSDRAVHRHGRVGQGVDGVVGEGQGHALGGHQRLVLADQVGLGLGQDAAEVVAGQRLQLDPDRQPPLQLGQQVRGLGHVEGARGDEQHVVGLHRPVLGRDGGALDQRQQVALHALAGDVGAGAVGAGGDLVDLVDEDDAAVLGRARASWVSASWSTSLSLSSAISGA